MLSGPLGSTICLPHTSSDALTVCGIFSLPPWRLDGAGLPAILPLYGENSSPHSAETPKLALVLQVTT